MPLGPSGRRADRAALEAGGCQGRTRHGQAEDHPSTGDPPPPPSRLSSPGSVTSRQRQRRRQVEAEAPQRLVRLQRRVDHGGVVGGALPDGLHRLARPSASTAAALWRSPQRLCLLPHLRRRQRWRRLRKAAGEAYTRAVGKTAAAIEGVRPRALLPTAAHACLSSRASAFLSRLCCTLSALLTLSLELRSAAVSACSRFRSM